MDNLQRYIACAFGATMWGAAFGTFFSWQNSVFVGAILGFMLGTLTVWLSTRNETRR